MRSNAMDGGESGLQPIMDQMLGSRRVGRSPLPDLELIGENFGRLMEDELRVIVKTIVGALILDCTVTKLSDVIDSIPVPSMLGLIRARNTDRLGLINLSSDLVYHLVDMRMGGDAGQAPIPTTRSFTPIDAQLCLDIFEAVLEAFRKSLVESLGLPIEAGLTIAGHKQDINTVRIAPKSADVLLITVSLDIGEAARSGDFELILPLSILDEVRASMLKMDVTESLSTDDLWYRQLSRFSVSAPVPLHAILHSVNMPIAGVEALKPGDVIAIPATAIEDIDMVQSLGTRHQAVLSTGRLGQFDGTKVIKLARSIPRQLDQSLRALFQDDDL